MFRKILIANRGEIACRIMRTAKQMGIQTVAVYSDADKKALHVRQADEAVWIGPPVATESYLNIGNIIKACKQTGAEAVHPGYGFLSEKPDFAEALEKEDITFIGPKTSSIRAMGLKDAAKSLMQKAGVPIVPGYQGEEQAPDFLKEQAGSIGYPILIKARAGGGGKGMRLVESSEEFASNLESAQREGLSSFGDSHVLLEKYIKRSRHIEVQVFGDTHGNILHLHERDCSLQRRHQKVIEEAPAPGLSKEMRHLMADAAVKAAKAVDYVGAGTVEFIVDVSDGLKPDAFYFLEMNTRLQVEHPVTECITGIDLVEWQILVAAGSPLPLQQKDIPCNGWAMEARLYAEDASRDFMPSTGTLEHLHLPSEAVRVDSGVEAGDEISPYYDPMIAKIISSGPDRDIARAKINAALQDIEVAGCITNSRFLMNLCQNEEFKSGGVYTALIGDSFDKLVNEPEADEDAFALCALAILGAFENVAQKSVWDQLSGWRQWGRAHQFARFVYQGDIQETKVEFEAQHSYLVHHKEQSTEVQILSIEGSQITYKKKGVIRKASVFVGQAIITVFSEAGTHNFSRISGCEKPEESPEETGQITAPMPGIIKAIPVQLQQSVQKGDLVTSMEAMKMEHSLTAPFNGIVTSIKVAEGDIVGEGAVLLVMESSDAA